MFKTNRIFKVLFIALLIIITINSKSFASNDLLNEDFLQKDINYIETLSDTELTKEINKLTSDIDKLMNDYETLDSGIKIYNPETTIKISNLKIAIINRNLKLNNSKDQYLSDAFVSYSCNSPNYIDRIPHKDEIAKMYEVTVNTLKSLNLNKKYVEGIKLFISPVSLKNAYGFAFIQNGKGLANNNEVVVIANYCFRHDVESDFYVNKVKDTVLHEIGHVVDGRICNEYNINAGKLYQHKNIKLTQKNDSKIISNKSSECLNENFAEDFRLYFSDKLGNESFKPGNKKTVYEYNESEMTKIFSSIEK